MTWKNIPIPTLALGLGSAFPDDQASKVFDLVESSGIEWIDTARIYPGSEEQIGNLGLGNRFKLITKAKGFRPGTGKRDSILQSIQESVIALKQEKVELFLIHSPDPDPTTSLAETMDTVQEVYKQGRFECFGISNFNPSQVREIYDYAKSKSYILPTVYQANYNLVARHNEAELFPLLRSLGMQIQVYSPIAGGFLARTPEQITNPLQGPGKWQAGHIYQTMYNKPSLVDYLRKYGEVAEQSGQSKIGIAYRWVAYHSAVGADDMLLFGASKIEQVAQTLKELEKGPLEDWIVKKLDEMWKGIEKDAPVNNFLGFMSFLSKNSANK